MEKGQIVKYLPFTDSQGEYHPGISKMVITKVYKINNNQDRVCAETINIERTTEIISVDASDSKFELI